MYKYVGDGSDHFAGIPARDMGDDEVEALGEALAKNVKASDKYHHEADVAHDAPQGAVAADVAHHAAPHPAVPTTAP